MLTINLKPQEEEKEGQEKSFFLRVIWIGLITIFGVAAIIASKYALNYTRIQNIDKQLNEVSAEKQDYSEFLDSYNKYMSHDARNALTNHLYYSLLIDNFKNTVPADIVITSLAFDEGLTVTAKGYSQNGIKSFTIFENNLSKVGYTNLTVKSVTREQETEKVNFDISFNFNQELIKK